MAKPNTEFKEIARTGNLNSLPKASPEEQFNRLPSHSAWTQKRNSSSWTSSDFTTVSLSNLLEPF